ncbi:MAG: 2-isopropylmalate synthase [Acidobacteria bacterium]|nr:MAG: 2-isopropylmalate synthase [Acidobacteriota bacterium]
MWEESMEMVRIFDTTLRDGEQAPGFSMNTAEKLQLARRLESLGVDVIEAGFPIASQGDFEAVREVARDIKHSTVAGLARARREDIDAALGALERAARPRVHVFLATSDLHLKHKLRISRTEALESIGKMVEYAKGHCPEVEFSAEDASRSDVEFLGQAFSVAADAGATILNAPDTVGYATPEEYGGMFRALRSKVSGRPGVIWSAHCHNDLGLAVANSLAAVKAGARQVECTINGIGERAGNAAMEEIAVALAVRPDRYETGTRLRLNELYATSRLLSEITGVSVPPNKAVVGANAFAHEAGIHQDGILKNPLTYQVISPEAVGVPAHRLVLGKHSGRNALRARLAELGVIISEDELRECYRQVMALADAKKEITDEDIKRLAGRPSANASISDVAV